MKKTRVGIVGSKFAADFHCDAFTRNPDVEIAAIASPSNPVVLAKKWNIPKVYNNFEEMFKKEKLDAVSVCAPNFLHYQISVSASNHNLHIICEKPLATTVEDGRNLIEICRKNKTKLFYGEDWCFAPTLKRIDALINEGGIGRILYVKAKEVHCGSHSPYAKTIKTCGGGCLIHLAIHPIGYLLYLLGKGKNPVVEVTGKMTGGSSGNFVHKDFEGEDFSIAILKFKNGEYGFAEGNYITVGGMDDKVEIYGTEGVLKADLTFGSNINCYSRKGISYSIEKTDHNLGWTKPAVDEFYNLGYVSEMKYFIDCIRNDQEPVYGVDGQAGLATLEIIDALYKSNKEGKSIKGEWK